MNSDIRLGDYTTTPLYNIKAVVQATDISPSTLRAWERRYNVCQPQRSESGYRLYSDRDVALIRWLKAQVDAGMAISQAVQWYETIARNTPQQEQVVLPGTNSQWTYSSIRGQIIGPSASVRSVDALRQELLDALLNFAERDAEQLLEEAFALYSIEQVGENVITPVLVDVGERWHQGILSATKEHYITNFLRQRLFALLRTMPQVNDSPLIWVGCAPGELHEIGTLLLCLYLRRAGHRVRYLGQNLPLAGFVEDVKSARPAMVLLSASTATALQELTKLAIELTALDPPRPIVGYGGRILNQQPETRNSIPGVFLEESALEAVDVIHKLLSDRTLRLQKDHKTIE